MTASEPFRLWLHRFSVVVVLATLLLIFIGGLVTSTGSGLAVPDWPSTYGQFMFAFPIAKMVGGILYEHGHRMTASIVGLLTIVLTVWIWRVETRRWLKWLAAFALVSVVLQGVLGGITVLYRLPTLVSVLHGCLAQTFLMITVAIMTFTSKHWLAQDPARVSKLDRPLLRMAATTTLVIYLQLILGALMRHSGAGLAIPDFPLAFGQLIPPIESKAVAIHFLHRVGAVTVSVSVMVVFGRVVKYYRKHPQIIRSAILLAAGLAVQITLAAFTIWTQKAVIPTTAHVATGALLLGLSLYLALLAWRFEQMPSSVARSPLETQA